MLRRNIWNIYYKFCGIQSSKRTVVFSLKRNLLSVYMFYPAPPLFSIFALPSDTTHHRRSPDIWSLPSHLFERKKKEKKINLGFGWFCCLSACDSWSAVRGEPTFISVRFLSRFPHVSLSTFGVRLASSAPSVQRSSPLPLDQSNEECFLWREAVRRFWNDWLQHNKNTQRYKDGGASSHITCPAFLLCQVYDNRAVVSHKYVLFSCS